jgi:hypothetical protein
MKSAQLGFRRKPEAGEAEMGLFIMVVIVCGLVSGSLFLLNWIKDSKDAKVQARNIDRKAEAAARKARPKREPGSYVTHCQKPLHLAFSTKVECEILDESYVEKELEAFRPEF